MSKETEFLIYCMERYRYIKGLSGAETARLFDRHEIYSYVNKYFEVLHTLSDQMIVQDIDEYIAGS